MIVIRVELHSAITGRVTELARAEICNTGEQRSPNIGTYSTRTLRGRSKEQLDKGTAQRTGLVRDWPRSQLHVWNLVAAALKAMGYGAEPRRGTAS